MIIRDDSHARAILTREKRLFSERFYSWKDYYSTQPPRKFKKSIAAFEKAIGDGLMHPSMAPATDQRTSKHLMYTALLLEPVLRDINRTLMDSAGLCSLSTVMLRNSKRGELRFEPFVYVSDHALERAVRRNQCHSWGDITNALNGILSDAMVVAINMGTLPRHGDFIIARPEGYAVFKGQPGPPILKTWLPREYWSRRQHLKFKNLTDGNAVILSEDEFRDSTSLDLSAEPMTTNHTQTFAPIALNS